jgi:hypothetical protein
MNFGTREVTHWWFRKVLDSPSGILQRVLIQEGEDGMTGLSCAAVDGNIVNEFDITFLVGFFMSRLGLEDLQKLKVDMTEPGTVYLEWVRK